VLVDDHHIDVGPLQLPCRTDPGEAPAEDQDASTRFGLEIAHSIPWVNLAVSLLAVVVDYHAPRRQAELWAPPSGAVQDAQLGYLRAAQIKYEVRSPSPL
jgi:hypothetical protein